MRLGFLFCFVCCFVVFCCLFLSVCCFVVVLVVCFCLFVFVVLLVFFCFVFLQIVLYNKHILFSLYKSLNVEDKTFLLITDINVYGMFAFFFLFSWIKVYGVQSNVTSFWIMHIHTKFVVNI